MSENIGIEPWNNTFLSEHARCTCAESEAAIELKPLSCFNMEMIQVLPMKILVNLNMCILLSDKQAIHCSCFSHEKASF